MSLDRHITYAETATILRGLLLKRRDYADLITYYCAFLSGLDQSFPEREFRKACRRKYPLRAAGRPFGRPSGSY